MEEDSLDKEIHKYVPILATATEQPGSSTLFAEEVAQIEQKLYHINNASPSFEMLLIDSLSCYLDQGKLMKIALSSNSGQAEYYYDEDMLPGQAYFVRLAQQHGTAENQLLESRYYFSEESLIRWVEDKQKIVPDTSTTYYYTSKDLIFRSSDLLNIWKNYQSNVQHEHYQRLVSDIDQLVARMQCKEYTMVGDSADATQRMEEEGFEETIRFYDAQGALAIYYTGYGGLHGTERIHEYYHERQLIYSITENTYWQHLYLPYNDLYGTSQHATVCKTYYKQDKRFRSISIEESTISLHSNSHPQIHHISIPMITDY